MAYAKQRPQTADEREKSKRRKALEEELLLRRELAKRRAKDEFEIYGPVFITITNKEGNETYLTFNNVQKKINAVVRKLKKEGKPPRLIILKARQEGVSTNEQARMIHNTTQKENRNGLIVAHRDDATSNIFEKAKYMYEKLDADMKPLNRASNAKELIFDTPTGYKGKDKGLNSKIRVQTAGKSGIGRGDTYHYVHLSEFAFWEGSNENTPKNQLVGIMQSVPDTVDSLVVIESTANGFNDFKTLWDEAVAGRNGFTPLFFPWYAHEEYVKKFESEEAKEKFKLEMDEYERNLYINMKLSLERIHWWRHTLQTKCNNNVAMMKQENPTTPEEAFIMSGDPVFNNEVVSRRIEYLRKSYELSPYERGYFKFEWNDSEYKDFIRDETIEFISSEEQPWIRIYRRPEPGRLYAIGGDTKGEGKDFFTGQVLDSTSALRVATLEMQVDTSMPFTSQMYCLGKMYKNALMGIEINFNTAPVDDLQRWKYPNIYQRQKYGNFTKDYMDKYGWKTDGTTRPLIIDKAIDMMNNHPELYYDIPTLQQAITFVYDKKRRPDAMPGKHDDLLMADMIAAEIRSQQQKVQEEEKLDIDVAILDIFFPTQYKDYEEACRRNELPELLRYWKKSGFIERLTLKRMEIQEKREGRVS